MKYIVGAMIIIGIFNGCCRYTYYSANKTSTETKDLYKKSYEPEVSYSKTIRF